jgi:hypothetical protein
VRASGRCPEPGALSNANAAPAHKTATVYGPAASGVVIGRREYAPGDRVIARRNDRTRDIDNGTLGTVIEIDSRNRRMRLQTDRGQRRQLDMSTSPNTSNTPTPSPATAPKAPP